jgi:hypothetical protein
MLLLTVYIISLESKNVNRTHIIHKDRIMSDHRLAEFSIFDSTETQHQYHIKAYASEIHAAVLYSSPSEQMVGIFGDEWLVYITKANISILDTHSNRWSDESITTKFDFFKDKYVISLYGTSIILKGKALMIDCELYDKKRGKLFAKFQPPSRFATWTPYKYKLEVFFNKVSNAVYFFALATMDHKNMYLGSYY